MYWWEKLRNFRKSHVFPGFKLYYFLDLGFTVFVGLFHKLMFNFLKCVFYLKK